MDLFDDSIETSWLDEMIRDTEKEKKKSKKKKSKANDDVFKVLV